MAWASQEQSVLCTEGELCSQLSLLPVLVLCLYREREEIWVCTSPWTYTRSSISDSWRLASAHAVLTAQSYNQQLPWGFLRGKPAALKAGVQPQDREQKAMGESTNTESSCGSLSSRQQSSAHHQKCSITSLFAAPAAVLCEASCGEQ